MASAEVSRRVEKVVGCSRSPRLRGRTVAETNASRRLQLREAMADRPRDEPLETVGAAHAVL
jgi:hypothetical protein